jgi:hypothetical protein
MLLNLGVLSLLMSSNASAACLRYVLQEYQSWGMQGPMKHPTFREHPGHHGQVVKLAMILNTFLQACSC